MAAPETRPAGGVVERARSIATSTAARVTALPPVVTFNKVMETYNGAAGGLLAAGLAYGALITLLLSMLLFVGVTGFVITDIPSREDLIRQLSAQLPPLAELVRDGVTALVESAGASSLFGLAGLIWGVSRFYGSLDEAFARIFLLAPVRGMVDKLIRGFASVVLLVGGFVGMLILAGVQQGVDALLPGGAAGDALRTALTIGLPLVQIAAVTLIVGLVYRVIPNLAVPLAALAPPAIAVGIVLSLLTQLFVFLAPRLVGALAVFGGFAAVFAALAWLSFAFQALLIGAAWVRERVRDADPTAVPPTPAESGTDPLQPGLRRPVREPLPPPPPGVPPAPPRELD